MSESDELITETIQEEDEEGVVATTTGDETTEEGEQPPAPPAESDHPPEEEDDDESNPDIWLSKRLTEFFGSEQADYFLNPKPKNSMISVDQGLYTCHEQKIRRGILRGLVKPSDKGFTKGIDEVWNKLRRVSEQKLFDMAKEDMNDGLSNAYTSYCNQVLLKQGKRPIARSFTRSNRDYEDALLDNRRQAHIHNFSHRLGMMQRAAKLNKDRFDMVLHNNPLEDVQQLEVKAIKDLIKADEIFNPSRMSSVSRAGPPSSGGQVSEKKKPHSNIHFLPNLDQSHYANTSRRVFSNQASQLPTNVLVSAEPPPDTPAVINDEAEDATKMKPKPEPLTQDALVEYAPQITPNLRWNADGQTYHVRAQSTTS